MFPILNTVRFSSFVRLILDRINQRSYSGMISVDDVSSVDFENHLFKMYSLQTSPEINGTSLRLFYKPRKISFYWQGESSCRGLFSSDYLEDRDIEDIIKKCINSI